MGEMTDRFGNELEDYPEFIEEQRDVVIPPTYGMTSYDSSGDRWMWEGTGEEYERRELSEEGPVYQNPETDLVVGPVVPLEETSQPAKPRKTLSTTIDRGVKGKMVFRDDEGNYYEYNFDIDLDSIDISDL